MLDDIYVSTKDAKSNIALTIAQKHVCLKISNFMLSRLLSFIIDLYNLIPLIDKAKIVGISIMFCNNIEEKINMLPFFIPKVAMALAALYPKQNPLKPIAPYTTNTPITVSPANHNNNAKDRFFFIEVMKSLI